MLSVSTIIRHTVLETYRTAAAQSASTSAWGYTVAPANPRDPKRSIDAPEMEFLEDLFAGHNEAASYTRR